MKSIMCLFEVMLSHNVDTKLYLQAYAYERNILLFGRYEIRPSSFINMYTYVFNDKDLQN